MPTFPSRGRIVGFLCGYLRGSNSPRVMGYQHGYLNKQSADEIWISAEEMDREKSEEDDEESEDTESVDKGKKEGEDSEPCDSE